MHVLGRRTVSPLTHVVPLALPGPLGHSSDSEDQSRVTSLPHKSHKSRPAASSSSSPPSQKDGKHSSSPQRMYKWTLQLGKRPAQSSVLLHYQAAGTYCYVKETAARIKPSDSPMLTNEQNSNTNIQVLFFKINAF